MYRSYFCSGLSTVMAVNDGDFGEWPRLSYLRRHFFFWESASWWGESWADTGRLFRIAHTLATTRGCRRGGVAGAEPPHKGGPNRPDRPELQWSVVSGQWSEEALHILQGCKRTGHSFVATRGTGKFTPILGCTPRKTPFSTEDTENGFFCPRRTRRGAENCCLVRGGGEGGQLREKEFTVSM